MRKQPFFSVVIPVYNVEPHLRKAINSILEQTFQEYEIILVNDCSTDNSKGICEVFTKNCENITLVNHEKNCGLSAARNTGMKYACGKYIWFMDSDDYVENNLLEEVYHSVQKNQADLVVFGLVEDYYDQHNALHHSKTVCPKTSYLSNLLEVRKQMIDLEMQTLYGYAWNKFYLLDRIKKLQLKYENITLIEDILFNVEYCMDIDSMNILSIAPYHYNKRMDQSLTGKFVQDYYKLHRKRIELIFHQYMQWDMCTDSVKQKLAVLYSRYIFSALQRNCDKRAKMNHKQRKKWMEHVFQDPLFQELISFGDSSSVIVKIMIVLLKYERTGFCLLLGRFIFVIKNKLPMVFAKVKQRR